jgi:hypothetical protein
VRLSPGGLTQFLGSHTFETCHFIPTPWDARLSDALPPRTAPGNERHALGPKRCSSSLSTLGTVLASRQLLLRTWCTTGQPSTDKADQHRGAEGIVSKKVDRTYRSGLSRAWIKVCNPTSTAVQRERSEKWNM